MPFLHLWALGIGGAAVGAPLLIHWLTRPRPVAWPLSTIRFVQQVLSQRRAHHRLRDALILLTRMIMILLLAIAFARPLWNRSAAAPVVRTGDVARVIMLDVSQSMAAREHGIALFERARAAAADALRQRPGLRGNLIFVGAQPTAALATPSPNLAALRRELTQVEPTAEQADFAAALRLAHDMLSSAGDANSGRELVIISDFQSCSWTALPKIKLPADTRLTLKPIQSEASLVNLAITKARVDRRGDDAAQLTLTVANHSETPRVVNVTATLAGHPFNLSDECAAQSNVELTQQIKINAEGWADGIARLQSVDDALPMDNERPFALNAHQPRRYALVSRADPDAGASNAYFVARALLPGDAAARRDEARLDYLKPDELDSATLSSVEVIVLVEPGRLASGPLTTLAGLALRGRAILYVASEAIDAENIAVIERAIGDRCAFPERFAPLNRRSAQQSFAVMTSGIEHAPFAVFGDELSRLVAELKCTPGLDSQPLEQALRDDVRARYADGPAFLTITDCGAGYVAVLNVDLSASNLPGSALFVPMMGELTSELLTRDASALIHCGEPLNVLLPHDVNLADELEVTAPQGAGEDYGRFVESSAGVHWEWNRVPVPGVYQVRQKDKPVFAIAAAIPADESDLHTAPLGAITALFDEIGAVEVAAVGLQQDEPDSAWATFLIAAALAAACELGLLMVFRT